MMSGVMLQMQGLFIQEPTFHEVVVNPIALSKARDAPLSAAHLEQDFAKPSGHDLAVKMSQR
jgi:hypothetical protein